MECLHLGYFTIQKRVEHVNWTQEDVEKRFASMPYYLKENKLCLTHLRNGFFEYHLVKAFPDELIFKFAQWQHDNTVLDRIMIWEHDIRPLTARYKTIADTLSKSGGREIKHVTDVTHYDIMDFIEKHMRREDFTREIKTPYDENLQHFVPPHVYANSISKEDSCAIIMHVSAAGMMRFDRTHSVSAHKKTGKPMATPLVAGESGLLPDPLRLAPLPFPNGDHDCIVQFNVSQAKKLVDHVYSQTAIEIDGRQVVVVPEHKPVTGGKAALVWNDDVVSEVNQYIMSQILFMLIVSRFTGAT